MTGVITSECECEEQEQPEEPRATDERLSVVELQEGVVVAGSVEGTVSGGDEAPAATLRRPTLRADRRDIDPPIDLVHPT